MTTDRDELLVRIVKSIGESDSLEEEYAFKALRTVVEKEKKVDSSIDEDYDYGFRDGYNQCLAEIKADIKKELK